MSKNIEELLDLKENLRKQLNKVTWEIDEIRRNCSHVKKEYSYTDSDSQNRKTSYYLCLECKEEIPKYC